MKDAIVAAVQLGSEVGCVQENAQRMIRWAKRAREAGVALVCFPECSLTGFSTERAMDTAIGPDAADVRRIREFARSSHLAIGFGYAEDRGGTLRPFNTYEIASADGCLRYRKTHLGAREAPAFSAGDELATARIGGICVGVQLCWEGHIADIAATLRAQGAELLLAPHAGGLGGVRRLQAWNRYLPARALDNGLFVVACNALRRAGEPDDALPARADADRAQATCADAGGGMAAYAPDGSLLSSYGGSDENLMLVRIGGALPRELPQNGMRNISYFDRRRPELYAG
ncbi:MAG TPA: hypothetical protein DCP91_07575 [Eggerthellaceae bacterium]|nr:hypothetical protein [Eggerthellaceae bacterium]